MSTSKVAVGLLTKLGIFGSALLAVAAAVIPFLDGSQTPESVTLLLGAIASLIAVIRERGRQNAALIAAQAAVKAAKLP